LGRVIIRGNVTEGNKFVSRSLKLTAGKNTHRIAVTWQG